jgi:hypothetical protein
MGPTRQWRSVLFRHLRRRYRHPRIGLRPRQRLLPPDQCLRSQLASNIRIRWPKVQTFLRLVFPLTGELPRSTLGFRHVQLVVGWKKKPIEKPPRLSDGFELFGGVNRQKLAGLIISANGLLAIAPCGSHNASSNELAEHYHLLRNPFPRTA